MANDVIYDDWIDKGNTLEEIGKHKEAIECFDKAIEIDEKKLHAWFSKGIVLQTLRKHKEAIECFDKTIERCDNAIDIDGNNVKAEAWISKAASLGEIHGIQFKPIPATVYPQEKYTANMKKEHQRWLGVTQAELDILYAVIECCDKAIEIDEKKLNAWSNKGYTLVLLRNHEEAIECFDNALKIDDRDKMSWWFKGYSLGQLLRIEEAKTCLSMAEKLSED
jgi:tetratricopeptide (TPR) repeat protein